MEIYITASFQVAPLEQLILRNLQILEMLKRFKILRCETACGLSAISGGEEHQINDLVYSVRKEAHDILNYSYFGLAAEQVKVYEIVTTRFKNYFIMN